MALGSKQPNNLDTPGKDRPRLDCVLLLDADRGRREALAFALNQLGCAVWSGGDPNEAIELCARRAPDFVIATTALSGMAATDLLLDLGGLAGGGPPVLMIAPEGRRTELMAAGAAAVLSPPFDLLDALAAAYLTTCGGELDLTLEELPLPVLARRIAAAGLSATVDLWRHDLGDADNPEESDEVTGELQFVRGELWSAGVGEHGGSEAFQRLLLWSSANVRIILGDDNQGEDGAGEREINKSTATILERGERFLGAFREGAARLGAGAGAVFRRDYERAGKVANRLPAEILDFLDRFDGERALWQVVAGAPFKPVETLAITQKLIALGAVVRRGESGVRPRREFTLEANGTIAGVSANLAPQPAATPTLPPAIPVAATIPNPVVTLTEAATNLVEVIIPKEVMTSDVDVVIPSGATPESAPTTNPVELAPPTEAAAPTTNPIQLVTPTEASPTTNPIQLVTPTEAAPTTEAPAPVEVAKTVEPEPVRRPRPIKELLPVKEALPSNDAPTGPIAKSPVRPPPLPATQVVPAVRRRETGGFQKVAFDPLEEDFFSRAAELDVVDAVDHFEDMGGSEPASDGKEPTDEALDWRRWLTVPARARKRR